MATEFNTQVGNGKYCLRFETDNREYYLLMQETARRCVDGKPVTNADRIRAMSDEELGCACTKSGIKEDGSRRKAPLNGSSSRRRRIAMTELKPCPFCGRKPYAIVYVNIGKGWASLHVRLYEKGYVKEG